MTKFWNQLSLIDLVMNKNVINKAWYLNAHSVQN